MPHSTTTIADCQEKKCSHCQEVKPLSGFYRDRCQADGYRHYCKDCVYKERRAYTQTSEGKEKRAEIQRRYRAAQKAKGIKRCAKQYTQNAKQRRHTIIAATKSSGCLCCGERRANGLVFHHLYDKDNNVALIRSYVALLREISKCVVLCGTCHLLLHAGDLMLDNPVPIDVTPYLPMIRDLRLKGRA